jgi:hypothetical protein
MKNTFYVILFSIVIAGCHFSKSVKKDFVSGLTSTGSGLTCEEVYLKVNDERTDRNSFIYGEIVNLVFEDVKGFKQENGKSFPKMQIIVNSLSGDTVFFADNLYSEYTEGMNFSPLQLTGDLTVAAPIKTGGEYLLTVTIKDRKGAGIYLSKLKFSVKGNDKIKIEPLNVSYNEVYLYSQGKNKVINDGMISFDDNIYILAEGIKGFKEENGLVFPGISFRGSDASGKAIFNYEDMFSDYSTTGIAVSDFNTKISAHFKLTGSEFNNPLHAVIIIWDKKSSARMKISTDMTVK